MGQSKVSFGPKHHVTVDISVTSVVDKPASPIKLMVVERPVDDALSIVVRNEKGPAPYRHRYGFSPPAVPLSLVLY
jgi:hypothetical protein